MANLEDTIRSAAPGGSIAKPLMLALLALLASGALFRGAGTGPAASTGSPPAPDEGAGGLLGGLGGLFKKLQKGGLGNVVNSWLAPVRISRCRIISSVQRLALISSRPSLSDQAFPKKS